MFYLNCIAGIFCNAGIWFKENSVVLCSFCNLYGENEFCCYVFIILPWFNRLTLHIILTLHRKQNYWLNVNVGKICVTSCLLNVTSADVNVTKTVPYVTWCRRYGTWWVLNLHLTLLKLTARYSRLTGTGIQSVRHKCLTSWTQVSDDMPETAEHPSPPAVRMKRSFTGNPDE